MPAGDLTSPYNLLVVGIFTIFLALAGALTGETVARIGRVINRDKEPKRFWGAIAMQSIGGVVLILYFLYKVYGPSN